MSCSDSDLSPKYDPHTSTQDYESLNVNEPVEYRPTTIAGSSMDGSSSPRHDICDDDGEEVEDDADDLPSLNSSPIENKNKSKHRDKSKDKKHKSHSKDKDHKSSKHSHKSSDRDKSKSHKDKIKEKDRSPNKKRSQVENMSDAELSLDRRRPDVSISSNSLCSKPAVINISPNDSPDVSSSMANGHVLDNEQIVKKKYSDSLSKSKSHSSSSSNKSNSNCSSNSINKDHKKLDKSKKDKRKDRDTHSEKRSGEDQESKKRKCDSDQGFGAALMGLEPSSSPSKKKKSKVSHKEKEEKPSKVINDHSDNSSKPSTSKTASQAPDISTPMLEQSFPPPMFDSIPKIDPNYKPLPRIPLPDVFLDDDMSTYPSYLPSFEPTKTSRLTQEQTLDKILSSKTKSKRQIYSGKASTAYSEVPSLFNLSVRCLQENIDALEFTGGIPFDLLKPVIERATAIQLFNLENYNPYLLEDTHQLWEQHCKKDFKNKQPEEMETSRDMYIRLTDERKQKLKSITENLQTKFVTKPPPRRTTQLAFEGTIAKPPKSVARAQARFGTGAPVGAPAKTTKSAEIMARKQAMTNVQRTERASAAGRTSASKKPKAPLMAKTMQFYKKTFRR